MWRWLLVVFAGCASSKSTVVLKLPPQTPSSAVVAMIPFTEAEVAAGEHLAVSSLYTWLERVDTARDEDDDATTVTFTVNAPTRSSSSRSARARRTRSTSTRGCSTSRENRSSAGFTGSAPSSASGAGGSSRAGP